LRHRHIVVGMITRPSFPALLRVRSRASLELELIALRHRVTALAPAPRSAPALLHRSAPPGVALPGSATGSPRHGAGCRQPWSRWHRKRLPHLLAMAITPSGTAQDEHRGECLQAGRLALLLRMLRRRNHWTILPARVGSIFRLRPGTEVYAYEVVAPK
jgi:hypothetical protein